MINDVSNMEFNTFLSNFSDPALAVGRKTPDLTTLASQRRTLRALNPLDKGVHSFVLSPFSFPFQRRACSVSPPKHLSIRSKEDTTDVNSARGSREPVKPSFMIGGCEQHRSQEHAQLNVIGEWLDKPEFEDIKTKM